MITDTPPDLYTRSPTLCPWCHLLTLRRAPTPRRYKDGQKLVESDRLRLVEESETKYVLLIDRMELTDAGSYSVVASNTMGQVRTAPVRRGCHAVLSLWL